MIVVLSAAPTSLNTFNVEKLFKSPADEVSAFAIGFAKNAQHAIRNNMYGLVMNYLSEAKSLRFLPGVTLIPAMMSSCISV